MVLLVLAEKGARAELSLVMLPRGEHLQPDHRARHPFAKVPVLEDGGFVLYETRAINAYLDRSLEGSSLAPSDARGFARMDQWIRIEESYLAPHAQPLLVETVFRRHLGGVRDESVVAAARADIQPTLDAADARLSGSPYLAGPAFTLADVHWMPFVEYLVQTGDEEHISSRAHLRAWWERVSARRTWHEVARTGPQPYDPAVTGDAIAALQPR